MLGIGLLIRLLIRLLVGLLIGILIGLLLRLLRLLIRLVGLLIRVLIGLLLIQLLVGLVRLIRFLIRLLVRVLIRLIRLIRLVRLLTGLLHRLHGSAAIGAEICIFRIRAAIWTEHFLHSLTGNRFKNRPVPCKLYFIIAHFGDKCNDKILSFRLGKMKHLFLLASVQSSCYDKNEKNRY